jgi:hypothetical protein
MGPRVQIIEFRAAISPGLSDAFAIVDGLHLVGGRREGF